MKSGRHRYGGDTALATLNHRNAHAAMRSCGPAALSWLLSWISREPAAWEASLLLADLNTSDSRLAECAAEALGNLCLAPDLVVPALGKEFQNSNPERRVAAARALAHFGDVAIPTLHEALADPIPEVHEMVTNALFWITLAHTNFASKSAPHRTSSMMTGAKTPVPRYTARLPCCARSISTNCGVGSFSDKTLEL